jgi:hypothetical protein
MRILIVNWRDFAHPWAGGGEVNIHEQAKRWVQWGHSVTMLCGGFPIRQPGAPRDTVVDGIRIIRRGGRFTVYLRAALHYLRHMRGQFDVVIDVSNGIPMLTPLYCRIPKVVIFHHIHLKQWFVEMPWPVAIVGWFLERFVVRTLYSGVPTVAISESTRLDLQRIGLDPAPVSVIRPGLDRHDYVVGDAKPDPLVYLGRLGNKRLDISSSSRGISPLSSQNPARPDRRREQANLELARRRCGRQGCLPGFVTRRKVRLLKGWVFVIPPQRGWGISVLEPTPAAFPP